MRCIIVTLSQERRLGRLTDLETKLQTVQMQLLVQLVELALPNY